MTDSGMINAMKTRFFLVDLLETALMAGLLWYCLAHHQAPFSWGFLLGYSYYAFFRLINRLTNTSF